MNTIDPEAISNELEEARKKIEADATKCGLDFFDTVFYMVSMEDMTQLIAYEGFPVRYPHWLHGMNSIESEVMQKYGQARFHECVINTDYANAFLLKNNTHVINKMVIAHVYGHVDFFKNNIWFSRTDRNMMLQMSRHARRIEMYEKKYGRREVEDFLTACQTINSLVDPYGVLLPTRAERLEDRLKESEAPIERPVIKSTGDPFVDRIWHDSEHEKETKRIEEALNRAKRFPRKMQRDVLLFLVDNARRFSNPNLPEWKVDILRMVRDESMYFAPNKMTTLMNEGWATYWHNKLMVEMGHAALEEIWDYNEVHTRVVMPNPKQLNPYMLGLNLYRWIEEKWNTGRHGLAYEECDDMRKKLDWDTKDMKGTEKIFDVRKNYNDILLIEHFFDEEFCNESGLFTFKKGYGGRSIIESKDFKKIKTQLIESVYNGGEPVISVKDANYNNKGILLLHHDYDINHKTIKLDRSLPVLRNIRQVWGRDVALETKVSFEDSGGKYLANTVIICTGESYYYRFMDETGDLMAEVEGDEKGPYPKEKEK